MDVTAWNNGVYKDTGAGYGIKISMKDRKRYFNRSWKYILFSLEGEVGEIKVNTDKKSFWTKTCGELINKEIGLWFIKHNLAPWLNYHPPHLILEHISKNRFHLRIRS